jgi:hypothetical protein
VLVMPGENLKISSLKHFGVRHLTVCDLLKILSLLLNEYWRYSWLHIIQDNVSIPLPGLDLFLILLDLDIDDIKILLLLGQSLTNNFIKRQQLHHNMRINFHKPHHFLPLKLFYLWLYIYVFHIIVFRIWTLLVCDIIHNF